MAYYLTPEAMQALAIGPVYGLKFAIGSDFGYVPGPSDTGVRGNILLSGSASAPSVAGPSTYKYSIGLSAVDDMRFGEIALLFGNGNLFALQSYAEPIHKTADPTDVDGVGGTIDMFVNTSGVVDFDLNSGNLMGELSTIDNLPLTADSRYKTYLVPHPKYLEIPIQIFRSNFLWGISNYTMIGKAIVDSASLGSVNVLGQFPMEPGDIIQFSSGVFSSNVRAVRDSNTGSTITSIGFARPLTQVPSVGEQIYLFKPASYNPDEINAAGGIANLPFLNIDGTKSMAGVLKMDSNRISGLGNPQFNGDAVHKAYVDLKVKNRVFTQIGVSGTQLLDAENYDNFNLSLSGNVQLTITGGFAGQKLIIKLRQDASGSRTVTLPATVRYNNAIPSYSATPNPYAIDKLGIQVDAQDSRYDLLAVAHNIVG